MAEGGFRKQSAFIFECECGAKIESHERSCVCPKCHCALEVRGWGDAAYAEAPIVEGPKP